MTRLSVNINKIALIRNARGHDMPNVVQFAKDLERFGAEGITVHPRPDERHVKYQDCHDLKPIVETEFNIEGYPNERFLEMVAKVKPHQCTLVPDSPEAITSDAGWDTVNNKTFLAEIVQFLHKHGCRVSLFIDPIEERLKAAKELGVERIEFYTGPYAWNYSTDREKAIAPYREAALICNDIGLGINAGHDLNLTNLKYFKDQIPNLLEVSIGHALVCDALYYGIENTVQLYKRQLN